MAKCDICKRDMVTAHGCVEHHYVHKEKRVQAIKFGSPKERFPVDKDEVCHDCNARFGQYHHPGCDMETCPVCGGQLLSCGCFGEVMEILFADPDAPKTKK